VEFQKGAQFSIIHRNSKKYLSARRKNNALIDGKIQLMFLNRQQSFQSIIDYKINC
tara:strand:+ start:339 stop:506 length:168 start_codon:yes stop_codon:yes gene_type:complete